MMCVHVVFWRIIVNGVKKVTELVNYYAYLGDIDRVALSSFCYWIYLGFHTGDIRLIPSS